MRKAICLATIVALLSFVSCAYGAVAIDDTDGYVGEVSNIKFEGQDIRISGSQATVLTNGHKTGVTTMVTGSTNISGAALSYGVLELLKSKQTQSLGIAAGTEGQLLTIVMMPTYQGTITIGDYLAGGVAHTGWSTILLNAAGDSVTLLWLDDTYGWIVVGQNGATIA